MSKKSWLYLGNELKKFREEKALLSQVDFAKSLGISKSLLCKVEAGERRLNTEVLDEIFNTYSLSTYDRLKFLIISELPFELKNTKDDCSNVIKLTIELKNNGLFYLAKRLINQSLNTFDDSVDFYVLLSTVNLMENKYKESEENINIALNLYKKGLNCVSTEFDMYHNYGNIFFNMSYSYEFKRMELIAKLIKENKYKKDIIINKKYLEISNEITELYLKTEKYFLIAYNIDNHDNRILSQLAKLYFNMANLNNNSDYINKAYEFLNMVLESNDINLNERVELSVLSSIIMTFKDMFQPALIILNNIIIFQPNNIIAYFAKAAVYSYASHNNLSMLEKSLDTIVKMLEVSGNDADLKLQVLADFNFENLRINELTKDKFEKILF